MRNVLSIVATAVVLIAGVALAAPPRQGTADLTSLSASGVTGDVKLKEFQATETQINAAIRGLQPGVEYRLEFSGAQSGVIETFTAKNSGLEHVNGRISVPMDQFNTISVVRTSDNATVASGNVIILV